MITYHVDMVRTLKRNKETNCKTDDLSQLPEKISGLADAQNHKICYNVESGGVCESYTEHNAEDRTINDEARCKCVAP
jgi:hypothetical protein